MSRSLLIFLIINFTLDVVNCYNCNCNSAINEFETSDKGIDNTVSPRPSGRPCPNKVLHMQLKSR